MRGVPERLIRWFPLALVSAACVAVARTAAAPLSDPDLWWHLRLGQDFIDQGSLHPPPWSAYSDRAWVPTQPLPEIVMARVESWFGLPGLAWLYGCALVGIVVAVYLGARTRASAVVSALATVLAVLGCTVALTPRPQLVSLVLMPVVVAAWMRTSTDGENRWWLIPLLAGWSLCHGFWFIGVGVSVVAAVAVTVDRRDPPRAFVRRLLIPVVATALVAASPVGPGVLSAPFRVSATARFITEWQRTDLTSGAALVVALMMLTTVGAWVVARRRLRVLDVLLLVAAAFLWWYSQRTVALGSVLAAPVLAGALQAVAYRGGEGDLPSSTRVDRQVLGAVAAGCLVVLGLVVGHTSDKPAASVPTGLDPALSRLPAHTAVFDSYTQGGWLAWAHPQLSRYVDGLTDAYSVRHLERYVRIADGDRGALALLRRERIEVAEVPRDSAIARALGRAGWRRLAQDAGYLLLQRPAN
jgi:hypothetical protein